MSLANTVDFDPTLTPPSGCDVNAKPTDDGGSPVVKIAHGVPRMVGDSGAGGQGGAVPPPPAGSGAAGWALKANGTWAAVSTPKVHKVGLSLWDASVIAPGSTASIQVDYNGTIIGYSLEADAVGYFEVQVAKKAGTQAVPVVPNPAVDVISGPTPITLLFQQTKGSGTLTGWTTSVVQWDSINFNITSAYGVKRVTLWLSIQEN